MFESSDFWRERSSFVCFSSAFNLEMMSGGAAEWGVWRLDENWQGVGEEGKSDDLGVLEAPIRMIWEVDARGSSWVSGTVGFVTVPALGGSMENCFGGVPVFWFISMFCVKMRSFWSWKTSSWRVWLPSFSDSRSWWSFATVNCTEWRYCACFRWSNGNFCIKGVVCWIVASE